MKYAGLAVFPALLLLLDHFSHAGVVKGATASAELTDGTVKVTVANVSQHDITGFVVRVSCKQPNGQTTSASHSTEYGAPAFTHKALNPGETTEVMIPMTQIVSVEDAEVIVAIYSDQTAEVKDELSFNDIIDRRQGLADALQMTADAVKAAVRDTDSGLTSAPPNVFAQQILQRLLDKGGAGRIDAGDKMFLQSLLQEEIDTLKTAPAGREREFVQGEANRLQKRATLAQKHADVRRLP
jgi:hypothetical protein